MTTVYQEDYDSFYERIYRRIKGLVCQTAAAACPQRPKTQEEKNLEEVRRIINLMSQPHDEEISLSGKEYGDFIDKNYKATYIKLKRLGDRKEIDILEAKIADEIKRHKTKNNEIFNTIERNTNRNHADSLFNDTELNEIIKIANDSMSYMSPKKKSLMDKIKDFFNK